MAAGTSRETTHGFTWHCDSTERRPGCAATLAPWREALEQKEQPWASRWISSAVTFPRVVRYIGDGSGAGSRG